MRVLTRVVTYLVIFMNILFANGWIKTQLITKQQHRRKFGLVHHATQYTIDDSICPPTRPHLLKKAVTKACASIDTYLSRKPIAAHTQQAFDNLVEMIGPDVSKMQIVLDSGCGTGRSTILLGESHPNHLVIGVDRSFTRLSKTIQHQPEHYDWTNNDDDDDDDDNQEDDDVLAASSKRPYCQKISENTFLVRAELVDFWTCCLQKRLTISEHYLLYPNPYPTQTRLTQRWYAHPSFPLILQMRSDTIVLRSNWEGYLKETAKAVEIAYEYYESSSSSSTHQDNHALPYLASARRGPEKRTDKTIAWTNFEQKYDDVGEETYELIFRSIINCEI